MPKPVVVARALAKGGGNRNLKQRFRTSSAQPGEPICACRFHRGKKSELDVRNHHQYVCRRCKRKWEKRRTQTIDREQVIREGLEAARTLLLLAGNPNPDLSVSPSPLKRKRDTFEESLTENPAENPAENPEENRVKRPRRRSSLRQLPLEILSKILSKVIDSKPQCATRGLAFETSTLSVSAEHGLSDEHILLPRKSIDDQLLRLNKWCYNEVIRLSFQGSAQVFRLAADTPPADVARKSFSEKWRDLFPLRGRKAQDILPFDDERPRLPKQRTPDGVKIFKLLRHIIIHSPPTLMKVDARSLVGPNMEISDVNLSHLDTAIDLDRASPLWVSWKRMRKLESVCLDLRVYSSDLNTERGCINKVEICERANEMASWLQLDLLVIAGLQSYSFATTYAFIPPERIETDDEIDGEPNWIKIFRRALRPGGRLILVDRLMNMLSYAPASFGTLG
ncbi:hypothetical protein GGS26DRAFT_576245 [Hypomontagnella submonticulosa]|nr:hypothetical protein GGS26DRAFT_576245 [Hypomontagnella submonticulosa]